MRAPVALAALLLFALAPAHAASDDEFVVNVVSARSLGCSPDFFTQPDLRVRVLVNGAPVLETVKAQDQEDPRFATWTKVRAPLPATIAIEIEEAEPAGILGGDTAWVACDTAPGATARYERAFHGATLTLVARGDDERAAEAIVIVGDDAPAPARVRVDDVNATSAVIMWDDDTSGTATAHQVALGGAGRVLGSGGAAAGALRLDALCDNHEHKVRVLRVAEPWVVTSDDVTFTTANAPPERPRVLRANLEAAKIAVEWHSPTAHDVAEYELHAGPAGFAPTSATVRDRFAPFAPTGTYRADIAHEADDAEVRIVTRDTGGLTATSEAFALGESADGPTGFPRACGTPSGTTTLSPPPNVFAPDEPDRVTAADAPRPTERPLPTWVLSGGALLVGLVLGMVVMLVIRR